MSRRDWTILDPGQRDRAGCDLARWRVAVRHKAIAERNLPAGIGEPPLIGAERLFVPVTEPGTEERQHIRIELLVEGGAAEARRIRAELRPGLRQCGRADG